MMNNELLEELLLQTLQHELGSAAIYQKAIGCASNAELKHEWEDNLSDVRDRIASLEQICQRFGFDPARDTPSRSALRASLQAVERSLESVVGGNDAVAAQLLACRCVVALEVDRRLNWQLLARCAERSTVAGAEEFKAECDRAGRLRDERVQHAQAWYKDMWFEALQLEERTSTEPQSAPSVTVVRANASNSASQFPRHAPAAAE